jgi:3-methyladenine DNA glycosylase AlkD
LARHARILTRDTISPLIALAQRKPWWETVDGLAPVIGGILKPAKEGDIYDHHEMDEAISHASMWVRRIAMTHQLGWRMRVDVECLFSYALALADDSDFFIRKAIGWALRDYARWNPDVVRAFMATHGSRFSALTVREALKHVALEEEVVQTPD